MEQSPIRPLVGRGRIAVAIAALLVALSLCSCGTSSQGQPAPESHEAEEEPQAEDTADDAQETPDLIDAFVDSFDASSDTPISDTVEFDPQDTGSGYYRTEYRLGAYNGSRGLHGSIGDLSIDVVEYGSYGGYYNLNLVRIYASGPEEQALVIYPTLAKALDPSLTDEDVQSVVDDYQGSMAHELTDGLSLVDSHENVRNDRLDLRLSDGGQSRTLEIYIDARVTEELHQ